MNGRSGDSCALTNPTVINLKNQCTTKFLLVEMINDGRLGRKDYIYLGGLKGFSNWWKNIINTNKLINIIIIFILLIIINIIIKIIVLMYVVWFI